MKARLRKFILSTEPINNDMDNFLYNIVMSREKQAFYLNSQIGIGALNKDDLIFIQTEGYITHYCTCKEKGPILINNNRNDRQLSINKPIKFKKPINSYIELNIRGQAWNILNSEQINILNKKIEENNNI